MQEALMSFMVSTFHTFFEGRSVGQPPKPCRDGHYAFHLPDLSDEMWAKFAKAMGREELLKEPRYATAKSRRENYDELEQLVSAWVKTKTRQELWETLSALGLSSAPVLSLGEVMEDRHLKARQAFIEIEHPQAGTVKVLAPWIRFSDTPSAITRAAPLVGQDNLEVYGKELGLTENEVRQLADEGAI
jgi:crotonobetainyl-CoA:carnitine CoA-transferase CaiB-like acyl-CoA transferase